MFYNSLNYSILKYKKIHIMNFYLKNYRVIEKIGIGSFAIVFSAEHLITNHKVAIKILPKNDPLEYNYKELLNRELIISKSLKHPFLCDVFEILEDENYVFIIMELLQNGNLYNKLKINGKLNEEEAKKIFFQMISALIYLHVNKKIIHRDLKVENILLDNNNSIRLIDFGLSKEFLDENSFNQTRCGSLVYAAPEIILGNKYNSKVDIWSIGIVLFTICAGYLPFDDSNEQILLKKIVYSNIIYPSHFSSNLKDLIEKLLNKDPEKRISILNIKEHDWLNKYIINYNFENYFSKSIDYSIIKTLINFGFEEKNILNSLKNDIESDIKTSYKILLREKLKEIIFKNNNFQEVFPKKILSLSNNGLPSKPNRNNSFPNPKNVTLNRRRSYCLKHFTFEENVEY